MNFRKTFLMAMLGCTMLVGCDGSNDKKDTAQSSGTFSDQGNALGARIDALGTSQQTADATITSLRQTITTLQSDLASQQTRGDASETNIADLKTQLQTAETDLGAFGDLASRIKSLDDALAVLQANPVLTQAQIANIGELDAGLEKVKTDLATAQDTLQKSATADQLAGNVSNLETAIGQKSDASIVTALTKQVNDLQTALAKNASDLTTLIGQKSDASTVAALTKQVNDLQTALAALTASTGTSTAALAKRVADLEAQTKLLSDQLAGAKTGGNQDLADYVNTMRGSNSSRDYSRGNTFPATAMPFGFNMWSPVNRSDSNWFFESNEEEGSTKMADSIQAFAVVHEPSPWIGNRQTLQIMPVRDNGGEPVTTKFVRPQSFQRKNEIAHAHYYSLTFDNGTRTEITPTDHAAYFRFTVPTAQPVLPVVLDTFGDTWGALTIDAAAGIVSGVTTHGDPAMFFYAKFDAPVASSGGTKFPTWLKFDTSKTKVVGMKIATSFISEDQAKANLDAEIGSKSFDDVMALAKAAWNDKLNIAQVEGATTDQKVILYSNMYRAFLYPNSAWEDVAGTPTYRSPYTRSQAIKTGKIWVNNGFWDTYRANWPLYTLLFPNQAGEMIDGFVNGYKDGGWVTRWSGPGYADSMVATSSDIIFADAYMKGVRNFDIDAAYASMLKNATVYSSDSDRGRKGMDKMPFYGYSLTGEAASWSLEAYLNDFGIGEMAKALGKTDDAAYLANRAIGYASLFDGTSTGNWAGGWLRGKDDKGNWRDPGTRPIDWGYAYTEGNAWSYAFLAPQDGQGLANLYGGRQQLKEKLDTFFTTHPTLDDGGSYGRIHEVKEAKTVDELANVGEYQHSNQTVHHSIYMYNYAGAPASGQKYLRDVMDKLYFSGFGSRGNSTGEGYIGDEDNGEQSSWYMFSAMGFYPVSMGRPEYAIGAPYFPKMTVRLTNANGKVNNIVINAPSVSSTNRYVQSVSLNGRPITRTYLAHSEIANGATLDFLMGPNPSLWGTGVNDAPSSITQGALKPTPLTSLLPRATYSVTASTATGMASLFDRTSGTTAWTSPAGAAGWIQADKKSSPSIDTVKFYTLTSYAPAANNPSGWVLKGSNDGTTWVTLDTRTNQTFAWRQQTRPFALATSASYAKYRLEFTGTTALSVAEFELYGVPDAVPAPAAAAAPVPAPPPVTSAG